MAILIEANCVVIRVDSILSKFKGGIDAFDAIVPNRTVCADNELLRIGFMHSDDVDSFIKKLTQAGLEHLRGEEAIDIVVVEQMRGFMSHCSWAEFGHIEQVPTQSIAACRLVDSQSAILSTPDGWEYEGSMSQTYTFIPEGQIEKSMKYLRREGNVDIYLNLLTGKEMYVGRSGES